MKMNPNTIIERYGRGRSTLRELLLDNEENWKRLEVVAAGYDIFWYCRQYLTGKVDKWALVDLVGENGLRWVLKDPFAKFING